MLEHNTSRLQVIPHYLCTSRDAFGLERLDRTMLRYTDSYMRVAFNPNRHSASYQAVKDLTHSKVRQHAWGNVYEHSCRSCGGGYFSSGLLWVALSTILDCAPSNLGALLGQRNILEKPCTANFQTGQEDEPAGHFSQR